MALSPCTWLKLQLLVILSMAVIGNCGPRIGIIGGGIGGAATAYQLRLLFGDEIEIDIYEQGKFGGRLATVTLGSRQYEAGGAIIHPKNVYMTNFTQMLGLKKRDTIPGTFGLYNGKEFVFKESKWQIVTFAKMLWRYGMSIIRLDPWITGMLHKFAKIYTIQNSGCAFTTAQKLMEAMNPEFPGMTQETFESYLKEKGFSPLFIRELAMAVMQTNYGQDTTTGAFVGAVALAAADPNLWSIDGGNYLVVEKLIDKSSATMHKAKVEQIILSSTGSFLVSAQGLDDKLKNEFNNSYDIVVIATPLVKDLNSIRFTNFPSPIGNFDGEYHRTVATFVRGSLNKKGLNFDMDSSPVDEILSINSSTMFNSIGRVYPVDVKKDGKYPEVWKLFSRQPLSREFIDTLFTSVEEVQVMDWLAYPHYQLPMKWQPFMIHPRLYYTSSIEWAASAMEMSAVAARNAALLAYNNWIGKKERVDCYDMKSSKDEL